MIEFELEELSNLEDKLEQASHDIENAINSEGDSSVNLLQVGMFLGKAMAAIESVTDVLNQKVMKEKRNPLSRQEFDHKYLQKSKPFQNLKAAAERYQSTVSGCSPCQSQAKVPPEIVEKTKGWTWADLDSPWYEDNRDDT